MENIFFVLYVLDRKKRNNTLAEYAFYKNYFDRFTADLEFFYNYDSGNKKPNYKGFYKYKAFIKFYENIVGSENIIKQAHDLRNANPLSHSSAELIDKGTTSRELKNCIKNLNYLIDSYYKIHK